ncbi:MAG: mannose-1-phosphate guanylyltransferase [Acidobacteria bacterium]|nr:mannose-1-phosphate guanylyltransferase [Acidobacteriota bacterium]
MAGGRGTRFWPRSRKARAKQVLEFFGEGTLIQQTVKRLEPVLPPERIWVLTNDALRAEIVRQLPQVPKAQIIAEPAARNTAPAIGLIAHVLQGLNPDSVLGVFPADHYITKPARFLRMVRPAFQSTAKGDLVVLGIQPRWAETGYGYIEFPPGVSAGSVQAAAVRSFREKPDAAKAAEFVKAGNFCWNAGMFFGKTAVFLEAMRAHLPKTASLIAGLPSVRSRKFGAALAEVFPRCESISIDYAIMEKARNVVGLAADDIGWNDVGSWNAVYELTKRDAAGNASRSEAVFHGSSGNFVDAAGKLVTLVGVKDLVVVDTPDALLIVDRHQAQSVGELVKVLEKMKRDELL